MNWKNRLAAAALIGLSASLPIQQASAADGRITTEQEFRAKAAGKKLVSESGWVDVGKDGSLMGEFGGRELTGKWYWEDQYYCRSVQLGGRDLGHDCQVVRVTEDGMVFHRGKGEGKMSPPYRAE
ncbi:MAG: hypothetical protein OXC28_13290 [Defluviicoccus sp.]|nr:hypothetical protein [Defluviicoccus sp.]